MIFSIIIPAYNEALLLTETIKRIQQAFSFLDAPSWEIIVCDNHSTDNTAEIAKENGATVVFEPINQISRARNRGASIAKGQWLIFIDADSYPVPELSHEVVELTKTDLFVGCGTTVKVIDGTWFNKLRMERLNPLMRLFNWSGGAFLLCEKEAFKQIKGFSEGLYALEEIDFVFRLKRHGRKIGKKFTVLHNYPIKTSGRKGEFSIGSIFNLFFSNILAIIFFLLYYLIPGKWSIKNLPKLLKFWYGSRKEN